MIKSFANKATQKIFELKFQKSIPNQIINRAKVRLDQIHAATKINQQWPVIFKWKKDGAHEVEITDYH